MDEEKLTGYPGLPSETKELVEPYSFKKTNITEEADRLLFDWRKEAARKQREILSNLPIGKLSEVLSPYMEMLSRDVERESGSNAVVNHLKEAVGDLEGYTVRSKEIDGEEHFLVKREPSPELSGMVLVFKSSDDIEEIQGTSEKGKYFRLLSQVYYNPDTDKAVDFSEIYQLSSKFFKEADLYVDPEMEDWFGEHTLDGEIYIGLGRGQYDVAGYIGAHEIAHEIQEFPHLAYESRFNEILSALKLKLGLVGSKGIAEELKKTARYRKYVNIARINILERNANAFAAGLIGKLADEGIRVLRKKELNSIIRERRKERREDEFYLDGSN